MGDKVNGVEIKSCLGDLYSVNWMENADQVGKNESLAAQFDYVKEKTSKSHVMAYGDQSWTSEPIGNFMGDEANVRMQASSLTKKSSDVDSRDIPLHLAYYNYLRANFKERREMADLLIAEVEHRQKIDALFYHLSEQVADKEKFFDTAKAPVECLCCDEVHQSIEDYCGGYTDYSLQYAASSSICVKFLMHRQLLKPCGVCVRFCVNVMTYFESLSVGCQLFVSMYMFNKFFNQMFCWVFDQF